MYACLPACLSVCLSARLSVCLSVCLPVCLSVCMYVCMRVWVYRSESLTRTHLELFSPKQVDQVEKFVKSSDGHCVFFRFCCLGPLQHFTQQSSSAPEAPRSVSELQCLAMITAWQGEHWGLHVTRQYIFQYTLLCIYIYKYVCV